MIKYDKQIIMKKLPMTSLLHSLVSLELERALPLYGQELQFCITTLA